MSLLSRLSSTSVTKINWKSHIYVQVTQMQNMAPLGTFREQPSPVQWEWRSCEFPMSAETVARNHCQLKPGKEKNGCTLLGHSEAVSVHLGEGHLIPTLHLVLLAKLSPANGEVALRLSCIRSHSRRNSDGGLVANQFILESIEIPWPQPAPKLGWNVLQQEIHTLDSNLPLLSWSYTLKECVTTFKNCFRIAKTKAAYDSLFQFSVSTASFTFETKSSRFA